MKIIKLLILFSTLIFFTTGNVFAQQTETIFHQGILTDDTGEVVEDGSFIFTFRIYNVEAGGESLWTENQVLQVRGGIFNAHLGSEDNLDLPFDEKYWIGVTIDGGDELQPRMPLSAVPYAMHALSVKDGVITGAKLDPEVIQAGANISVELDENNNFVISADTPEGGLLSVSSDSTLKGDGTGGSPLGLDYTELFISESNLMDESVSGKKITDTALQGGANVTVERDETTQNFIISADTPEGGLLTVSSDSTLKGNGTDENPLGLDYTELTVSEGNLQAQSVTGEKINNDAFQAGTNISIDRDEVTQNFIISADTLEGNFVECLGDNCPVVGESGRFYLDGNTDDGASFRVGSTGLFSTGIISSENMLIERYLRVDQNISTQSRIGAGVYPFAPQFPVHVRPSTDDLDELNAAIAMSRADTGERDAWTLGLNDINGNFHFRYTTDFTSEDTERMAWISNSTGAYTETSDRNLKRDIRTVDNILDRVLQLRATRYQFNRQNQSDERRNFGFIAQEVQEIFPDLVVQEEDILGLSYANFSVLAIKAIQEQQEIIESQQQELDQIKQVLRDAGYDID